MQRQNFMERKTTTFSKASNAIVSKGKTTSQAYKSDDGKYSHIVSGVNLNFGIKKGDRAVINGKFGQTRLIAQSDFIPNEAGKSLFAKRQKLKDSLDDMLGGFDLEPDLR